MWSSKTSSAQKKKGGNGVVAVAINKDKGSQNALKWACDNLLSRGQSVVLIHVQKTPSSSSSIVGTNSPLRSQLEKITKELFLTFRCFCTRKDIQCLDVVLEDTDVVKSLIEYVSYASVESLVLGTASRHGFIRFKTTNIPSSVSKGAPDFCSVYIISKGKISSVRNATRQATYSSPLLNQIENISKTKNDSSDTQSGKERSTFRPRNINDDPQEKAPFARVGKLYRDLPEPDSDISFISSGRPDTDISFVSSDRPSADRSSAYSLLFDEQPNRTSRVSTSSEPGFGPSQFGSRMFDSGSQYQFSSVSHDNDRTSFSSQPPDEVESEMRRLKLELKQTMDMYSAACKEALTAKQKAKELTMVDNGRSEASTVVIQDDIRYRRYTIEEIEAATESFSESRKIGEGGYGPVYKCRLDHTPVAVKCLRPDAAQGRTQFNQEVEVLTCIRHPNMVLLLGACPEYGCLVYEHMANGSLEDCLFRKKNTPALSWQLRFRISAEIATGLLFLHQTKPEPLVHRDLKPGNILLDNNYVSKISDVGLAKLVPNIAECHMTAAAGTFCYIDPEYQQTGMLGVKSDVYSLGILLLQIITVKPAMGLAHNVERAIEKGKLFEMLDPAVPDWPREEVFCFARLALRCAELRQKDRPDLGKEVLPELSRLRDIAEESMGQVSLISGGAGPSPTSHLR